MLTLKAPNQGFWVKGMVCGARAAARGEGSVGERVNKVADDEVLVGEVVEGEAGASGEEGARGAGAAAFHGRDHHQWRVWMRVHMGRRELNWGLGMSSSVDLVDDAAHKVPTYGTCCLRRRAGTYRGQAVVAAGGAAVGARWRQGYSGPSSVTNQRASIQPHSVMPWN